MAGINEGAPYVIVVGLPSLDPFGHTDCLAYSTVKGDEELARRLAAAFEQGDDVEFDDESGTVTVVVGGAASSGLEEKRRALTELLASARRICRGSVSPEIGSSSGSLDYQPSTRRVTCMVGLRCILSLHRERVGSGRVPHAGMPPSLPRAGELSDLLGEVLGRPRKARHSEGCPYHPFLLLRVKGRRVHCSTLKLALVVWQWVSLVKVAAAVAAAAVGSVAVAATVAVAVIDTGVTQAAGMAMAVAAVTSVTMTIMTTTTR